MSISAVSSSSSSGFTGQSTASIDTAIARIQKQITQVQKQITDETNSKDDAKTKARLEQMYLVEIVALQAQLTQLQVQKQKNATTPNQEVAQPAAQSASSATTSSATTPNPANPGWSRYLNTVV